MPIESVAFILKSKTPPPSKNSEKFPDVGAVGTAPSRACRVYCNPPLSPCAPVGPVAPVSPVAPVGPVDPVTDVPVVPVAPVGPVDPCAP